MRIALICIAALSLASCGTVAARIGGNFKVETIPPPTDDMQVPVPEPVIPPEPLGS